VSAITRNRLTAKYNHFHAGSKLKGEKHTPGHFNNDIISIPAFPEKTLEKGKI
jgi:hypothetical protein